MWHISVFMSASSLSVADLQYHLGQASNRSLFHTVLPLDMRFTRTHLSLQNQVCVSHPSTSAVLSERIAVVHHCYKNTLSSSNKQKTPSILSHLMSGHECMLARICL